MPRWCEDVTLENGTRAIFCHSGRRPEKRCHICGSPAPWLCDYVLEFGLENPTCGRPLCNDHRVKMGKCFDYCPEHAELSRKLKAGEAVG